MQTTITETIKNNSYFKENTTVYDKIVNNKPDDFDVFNHIFMNAFQFEKSFYIKDFDGIDFVASKINNDKWSVIINPEEDSTMSANISVSAYADTIEELQAIRPFILENMDEVFKKIDEFMISKEIINDSICENIVDEDQINKSKTEGVFNSMTYDDTQKAFKLDISIKQFFCGSERFSPDYLLLSGSIFTLFNKTLTIDNFNFIKSLNSSYFLYLVEEEDPELIDEFKSLVSFDENNNFTEESKELLIMRFKE